MRLAKKIAFIVCALPALLHFGAAPSLSASKPLVHFGINLRHSPRTMYERYQPLMDYLTRNTPYRFELLISRDYKEALRDLKEGRALISSLGDGAFVEAMLVDGAVPIVKPLNSDGRPFYRAAIIVPLNSGVGSIAELKGKSFAFGSHHSISGNLLPRYMLAQSGVGMPELGRIVGLKNHDAVTKSILKGRFDAGAVKDVFAEKYRQYGLRVVAYSDPVASVPLVARRNAPKRLTDAVVAALLRLDPGNPDDAGILSQWDDEFRHGFTAASALEYREVIRMFRAVPFGCGTGCHR